MCAQCIGNEEKVFIVLGMLHSPLVILHCVLNYVDKYSTSDTS